MASAPFIPFSEPLWLQGLPSPYFNASHLKWQRDCRNFIEEHLGRHAINWENEGDVPASVFEAFSKHNMLIPNLPAPLPTEVLHEQGIYELIGGLKIVDFDYMHYYIYINEMKRSGIGGPPSSLATGMAYGVPPLIAYGSKVLQQRFLPPLLKGEKRICIAITEPDAGSDVANISTRAEKTADGNFYIVNGIKKW